MAGYTRQSTFADGDTITAALFNNEYNQLLNAFNSLSGHKHDGTTGEGAVIALIGDTGVATPLNKVLIDSTNDHIEFWVDVSSSSVQQLYIADGAIVPVTDNDIDLGTSSLQFKDLYINGTANIDSLVLASGSTVTAILDEDDLSSDSATSLVTQQSVKAYIDAQVTAQDLDFAGDTGGALSIDLDSESLTIAGGTGIDTSGATNTLTVAIDSTVATLTGSQTLTNKTIDVDNNTVSNIEVDNFKASAIVLESEGIGSNDNDTSLPTSAAVKDYVDTQITAEDLDITTDSGTIAIDLDSETLTVTGGTGLDSSATGNAVTLAIDSTVTTLTGTQTLTNKTLTSATLTSPVINTGVSGTAFLDDDTFATATASTLASSESIKAYVDSQVDTVDTLAEILANGNVTSGTDISVSTGDDITFADSSKAIFGDSVDLSIQHDATDSSIINTTGDISIINNADDADVVIRSDDGSGGNAVYFRADGSTGSTSMHHYGDKKIETVSQGVVITGNATFDDTSKILLGTDNDLQIFHDGDNSFIKEVGTGDLRLLGSAKIDLRSNDDATVMIRANAGGSVDLRYNGDNKLTTTSTGIDVTGTVTADGATIAGTLELDSNNLDHTGLSPQYNMIESDVTGNNTQFLQVAGDLRIRTIDDSKANPVERLRIDHATGDISFYEDTGTTQAFFWDASAESLGIGTTSPQQLLTIGNHSTIATSGNMGIRTTSSGHAISIVENGTAGAGTDESWQLGVNSSGDLGFFNSSSTTAAVTFLDSNDNVGIGTTNPLAKLHIDSNDTTNGDLMIGGNSDPMGFACEYIGNNDIKLHVGRKFSSDATFGKLVTFDDSGNVGIGTDSPNQMLELSANNGAGAINVLRFNDSDTAVASGQTTGRIEFAENDGGDTTVSAFLEVETVATAGGGIMTFGTGTAGVTADEKMRIDSSGNVGIGTSSPVAKLHIENGDMRIEKDTKATIGFRGHTTGSTALAFRDSNTAVDRMTIDSSGNVGIGVNNPSSYWGQADNLVVGGTGNDGITIKSSTSGNGRLIFTDTESSTAGQNDGGQIQYNHASDYMTLRTNGAEQVRIDSTGNVGIGTDSPFSSARLQVNTGTNLNLAVQTGTTDTSGMKINAFNDAGSANIPLEINGSVMLLKTGETERARITSSGNVGIGESNPQELLHLTATTPVFRMQGGSRTYQQYVSGTNFIIRDVTATANRITLDSSGNVGIGTDSPARKLHLQDSGAVWLQMTTTNTSTGTAGLLFGDTNATTKTRIVNDATDNLQFWTSTEQKMTLDSSGNLLVGTTSDSIAGANTTGVVLSPNSAAQFSRDGGHVLDINRVQDGQIVRFRSAGGIEGSISISGSTTSYNTSSDARLKDVTGEARGLEVINELNPVSYNWKADGKADEGLIAQEVQELVPNAVSGSEEEMYQMDYSKLVVHLVKAVKEQQAQIDALQSEINLLKGE